MQFPAPGWNPPLSTLSSTSPAHLMLKAPAFFHPHGTFRDHIQSARSIWKLTYKKTKQEHFIPSAKKKEEEKKITRVSQGRAERNRGARRDRNWASERKGGFSNPFKVHFYPRLVPHIYNVNICPQQDYFASFYFLNAKHYLQREVGKLWIKVGYLWQEPSRSLKINHFEEQNEILQQVISESSSIFLRCNVQVSQGPGYQKTCSCDPSTNSHSRRGGGGGAAEAWTEPSPRSSQAQQVTQAAESRRDRERETRASEKEKTWLWLSSLLLSSWRIWSKLLPFPGPLLSHLQDGDGTDYAAELFVDIKKYALNKATFLYLNSFSPPFFSSSHFYSLACIQDRSRGVGEITQDL